MGDYISDYKQDPLTVGRIVLPSNFNGNLSRVMDDLRYRMESAVEKTKMQEDHPGRKCYTKKEYAQLLQEAFVQKLNEKEGLRNVVASMLNIPPRYMGAKLGDFSNGSFVTANHEGVDLQINEDGLMISGGPGSGKTHLACALLIEQALSYVDIETPRYVPEVHKLTVREEDLIVIDGVTTSRKLLKIEIHPQWSQARFVSIPNMLMSVKESFGNRDQENILRDYVDNYKLLVLDDLASEQSTEKSKEEVSWSNATIYYIVSERINRMNPTIVTSNLKLAEISKRNPRIASRLGGMNYVSMGDMDRRLNKSKTITYKINEEK
jgi:DNA replication protein DnaC